MNITELFEVLIYVVVAILSVYVIPVIRNKYNSQELETFLTWVDIAVAAAEQLYDATDGSKKKMYVMNYLTMKGFTVETAELDLAIEAAVNRLHSELYGTVIAE